GRDGLWPPPGGGFRPRLLAGLKFRPAAVGPWLAVVAAGSAGSGASRPGAPGISPAVCRQRRGPDENRLPPRRTRIGRPQGWQASIPPGGEVTLLPRSAPAWSWTGPTPRPRHLGPL